MSFRVCIVGCGDHSRTAHGPSLRWYAGARSDVELAACCDRDPGRAESFRREFGFLRASTDMDDMLAVEKPDAVYIAVPPEACVALAERVLLRGVPLLLEKPPGMRGRETARLARIAGRLKVPHLVAFNRRFIPLMMELERTLRALEGEAGIQLIAYDMIRVDRREPDFAGTAVHAIDAARFLAGSDYRTVRFSYDDMPALGPGVANVTMDGRFMCGARFHVRICPAAGAVIERAAVHLHGHSLYLELPIWNAVDAPGRLVHLAAGKLVREVSGTALHPGSGLFETGGFLQETMRFLDDVRAGRMPPSDLASAVQSVQVMERMALRARSYSRRS
jgi:myo-inositol 2-dehydrogenase/D-chiro-inositol 1-dehydrogenase